MTRLLVVDTETSGLDPTRHSVLAVAAVTWDGGEIIDSFENYVWEPNMQVDPESMAVNRIELDWLRERGKPPGEVVTAMESFLDTSFGSPDTSPKLRLAGHNLLFDIPFLKALYAKAGCEYSRRFSHRSIDTSSILAALILAGRLDLSEASSTAAFSYFGISPTHNRRHTALGDAIATAHLLTTLINELRQSDETCHFAGKSIVHQPV